MAQTINFLTEIVLQILFGENFITKKISLGTCYIGALMRRHSGVLGLAALVEACPYSVPEWLPDILDEMAVHLQDPAPIHVRKGAWSVLDSQIRGT